MRSYWIEAIAFGLVEQAALQRMAEQLGQLPADPASTSGLDALYAEWLAVRQRLWWSHVSAATETPNEILARVRAENGTVQLYRDLDADFDTFVARRREQRDAQEERALRNLQIGGAGLATSGTLSRPRLRWSLQGVDLSTCQRVAIPIGVLVFGIVAAGIVSWVLGSRNAG